MTFEEELLSRIAGALNVPADLLGEAYRSPDPETQRFWRWWAEHERITRKIGEAMMQRLAADLALAIFIEDGTLVERVCGYDPQKLLPDTRMSYRRWTDEHGDHSMLSFRMPRPESDWIGRYFEDDGRVWHYPESGLGEPYVPDVRRWNHPESTPLEDIARWRESMMVPRTRTYEHKAAFIRVDQVDWSHLELRALAADPRIRCIILDIDSPSGDLPNRQAELYAYGAMLEAKPTVSTSTGIRDMSYLDHDPTKRHKRRKRR